MDLVSSTRRSRIDLPAAQAWERVAAAGPGPHWYLDALPLRFRSALDRAVGGDGAAHEPPDRELLQAGDRAGFWLVRSASHRTLELTAEVRAPGEVRLTTKVLPDGDGSSLVQSVVFRPRGLAGAAYLLADLPAREVVIDLVHRRTRAELR